MSFPDAVRSVLSKYATFSGRARRSEYWWYVLFYAILAILASIIDSAMGTDPGRTGIVGTILGLALLLPSIAVSVRRLHDTGRSGWWLLLALVPIVGAIVLIVWYCQDSHGDNQYGPSPKAATPVTGYTAPAS